MRTTIVSSAFLALSFLVAPACGDDGGANTTLTGPGDGSNTSGNDTDDPTGNSGDDGQTSQDSQDSSGGVTTNDPDDGVDDGLECPNAPQANGASCTEDCECESEQCYFISVLGGQCGECTEDADCKGGGCTIPNPLADPPTGSVCNDGSNGQGCETDAVCQEGLSCGTLVEVPGIITLSTCGQCLTDADCKAPQLCAPTLNIAAFTGELICVDPGTVVNGQACNHLGTGDTACESGICATVDIMGIVQVGVCGECEVDGDCMDGETCSPADINIDTQEVIPPTCTAA